MIAHVEKFAPVGNWVSSYRYTGSSTFRSTTPSQSDTVKRTGISSSKQFLSLAYLKPGNTVPTMGESTFSSAYKDRVENIGDWVTDHCWVDDSDELTDAHAVFDYAARYGAFLRPGSWVKVEFAGEECSAQVYRLPNTFPKGDYILRVLVPGEGRDGRTKVEPIFLARTIDGILDGEDLILDDLARPMQAIPVTF